MKRVTVINEFAIRLALAELARLGSDHPGRPGYGHPCSHLIADAITWQSHVICLTAKIFALGSHSEYRLNGAGLKLYYHRWQDGHIDMTVGGDQAADYPVFVRAANTYLRRVGLQYD